MARGPLCIAGGGEFAPACDPLDQLLVAAAPPGAVVILPSAAQQGREYDLAGRNGLRHHQRLSPERAVMVATDPRRDAVRTRAELATAGIVVLPGGSPRRLLETLTGPLEGVIEEAVERGTAVSGASAGAMVLCDTTLLPESGTTAQGLALVPGAVLPHYPSTRDWRRRLHDITPLWGLPECGGVVIEGDLARVDGAPGVIIVSLHDEAELPPGASWTLGADRL